MVQLVAQLVHRLLELEHREQLVDRRARRARATGRSCAGSPSRNSARARASQPGGRLGRRAAAATPRRRTRTSAASRRRRAAGCACGGVRAASARARPRSRGAPSRRRRGASGRDGSRRGGGSPGRCRRPASAAAAARAPLRRGRGSGPTSSSSSGRSTKTLSISSSIDAVSRPSDSDDGYSGAKLGSVRSLPSSVCMRARHLAEADTARCRNASAVVAHRVERQLPPVASRPGRTAGGSRASRPSAARVRVPAGELRDVLEAVLGQEAQQLELGVDPGLEPAEDLQDQLLVEDDRRVRLLRADRARLSQLESGCRRSSRRRRTRRSPPRPAPSLPSGSSRTSSRTWRGSASASRPPSTSS